MPAQEEMLKFLPQLPYPEPENCYLSKIGTDFGRNTFEKYLGNLVLEDLSGIITYIISVQELLPK